MSKLFVYGTLKKGFGNHRLLAGCQYQGTATLYGYGMYSLGGFPAIIPMKDHAVEGELYDVSDFTRLDALEGYRPERASDSMYIRQEVNVIQGHLDDTDAVPAHVYVWNCGVMGRKFIPEGVWK